MIDQTFQIREKLAQLQDQLENNVPGIANLLRDIHREIKRDPDVATILTEDECVILVNGLKKQTASEIATTAAKKKPKKALKNMTTADL